MTAMPDSPARTRAFARVLGPCLAIVPSLVVLKFPQAAALAPPYFANPALVWITGADVFWGRFHYRQPPVLARRLGDPDLAVRLDSGPGLLTGLLTGLNCRYGA